MRILVAMIGGAFLLATVPAGAFPLSVPQSASQAMSVQAKKKEAKKKKEEPFKPQEKVGY